MEVTLWMLDFRNEYTSGMGELVPLYAEDEESAWVEAHCWAMQQGTVIPETAILVHFPHGFTIHRQTLPGKISGG